MIRRISAINSSLIIILQIFHLQTSNQPTDLGGPLSAAFLATFGRSFWKGLNVEKAAVGGNVNFNP